MIKVGEAFLDELVKCGIGPAVLPAAGGLLKGIAGFFGRQALMTGASSLASGAINKMNQPKAPKPPKPMMPAAPLPNNFSPLRGDFQPHPLDLSAGR